MMLCPASAYAKAAPLPEGAGDAAQGNSDSDIVVTASRRSESVSKLPFNISAYGSEQLAKSAITSVTALSSQVPNFVVQDQGARGSAAAIPIIRGLNASGSVSVAPRYFQSPVGIYQGNAVVTGSLPIMDLERVEVLRGPQGTLYGAGALSGAVRLVPAAPQLGKFSANISGAASRLSYSHDTGYDLGGMINLPIGANAALRIAVKHQREAGFIDAKNVFARENNNYINGLPLLANPSDVVGSKGVYFNKDDYNYSRTTALRASFLWEPIDALKLEASYSFAKVKGMGAPIDNKGYEGGPSPIDPRVVFEPTGAYERSQPMLEPFERKTHLATLDTSYDMGFATLATTLAYGHTKGTAAADATVSLLGTPYSFYYTGTPANPRAVLPINNLDREENITEELRLVSNPGGRIDYSVGTFFQQQSRTLGLDIYAPGAGIYSAALYNGSTSPIGAGGTYVSVLGDQSVQLGRSRQTFREASVFGDVTFHATDRWQLTAGARVFRQKFRQKYQVTNSLFFLDLNEANRTSGSSKIFKANTSYQLDAKNQVYFTFSQGFRRGGANSFPTAGVVQEPAALLTYSSDKTNNYEVGFKGQLLGLRYSADAFYIDWQKPQIDMTTPYVLTYVVINGGKAESKGFEFELAGPIGPKGLSVNLGFAYARARLTENFALPAGSGGGTIIPNAIVGSKGDRLPGAPDYSGSGSINYETNAGPGKVSLSVGADYRSSIVASLPYMQRPLPYYTAPGYVLFRASVGYSVDGWDITLFGSNLTNKRVATSSPNRTQTSINMLGNWGESYFVNKPREIGLRLSRSF